MKKNVKFDGNTGKYVDHNYWFHTLLFDVDGDSLKIGCIPYRKRNPTAFLVIPDFKKKSACEVIMSNPDLGRHFEDGVHDVYHVLGLKLGYVSGEL